MGSTPRTIRHGPRKLLGSSLGANKNSEHGRPLGANHKPSKLWGPCSIHILKTPFFFGSVSPLCSYTRTHPPFSQHTHLTYSYTWTHSLFSQHTHNLTYSSTRTHSPFSQHTHLLLSVALSVLPAPTTTCSDLTPSPSPAALAMPNPPAGANSTYFQSGMGHTDF